MKSSTQLTLAPGMAMVVLAAAIVASGFSVLGLKIFPFGGLAVASVLMCAAMMYKRRTNEPGYAAPFAAALLVAASMLIPF